MSPVGFSVKNCRNMRLRRPERAVPRETPMVAGLWLFGGPGALAGLLAGGLEITRVARYTVIVDVLAIGHVRHLRIAANAKGAAGASLDEGHFNLLVLELRLAETAAEQFGRDVAILL